MCVDRVKDCSVRRVCDGITIRKVSTQFGLISITDTRVLNNFKNEAKKRGLTCDVVASKTDFKQAFISEPKLKRQQLQYALKKLNFYSYGIDGLWGKGTNAGFDKFVDKVGMRSNSESEVFKALLSRVSVPSSLASYKKKLFHPAKPKFRNKRGYTSYGSPSVSVAQALDICSSAGSNAFDSTSNAARFKSNSYSGRCNNYGYNTNCTVSQNSPYGNSVGTGIAVGIMEGLARGMAGKAAREREMKACMAHYGWKKN